MSRVFGGCRALMAAAAAKAAGTKAAMAAPASNAKLAAAKPKIFSGIQKPVPVSPAMKEFLGGAPEISRAGAIKKIWEYIKLHDLQNPVNGREINCDEKLKVIFEGRDKVHMMEISKLLSLHFVKSG